MPYLADIDAYHALALLQGLVHRPYRQGAESAELAQPAERTRAFRTQFVLGQTPNAQRDRPSQTQERLEESGKRGSFSAKARVMNDDRCFAGLARD